MLDMSKINFVDIIEKKLNKKELTKKEMNFSILNFAQNIIPDFQFASFLTACFLNGLSDKETIYMTQAMINSGEILDLKKISGLKVDKHSTGGVGDKVTLILGPIVAALGLKMLKMSGKSLGHTGGTIDKIESIKNFNTKISQEKIFHQLKKINFVLISQQKKIAYADKKIYNLRNLTANVNSIPLIAASIMSKKIASGADVILLDVKVGDGAFFKKKKDAKKLANLMKKIGAYFKKKILIQISDMSIPLGKSIGNKVEVLESYQCLQGNCNSKLINLCLDLAAHILCTTKPNLTKKEAFLEAKKVWENKKALKIFQKFIESQNGDFQNLISADFFKPKYKHEIFSPKSGIIKIKSALIFAKISVNLGAGQKNKNKKIDYDAGIIFNKVDGEYIKEKELFLTLYSSSKIDTNILIDLEKSYDIIV